MVDVDFRFKAGDFSQDTIVDRRITFRFSGTISFRWQSLNEPGKGIGAICEPGSCPLLGMDELIGGELDIP